MDTLRGHDVANDHDDFDYGDDPSFDAPPSVVSEERRMQVRAYNYWASLLGERSLPSIKDLSPDELEDFGPHSVLLDFSTGLDNPAIAYLGAALRQECDIQGAIACINDVPARSLLSRLTDHYLRIVANAAPIGFEAEFVNQRGAEILYRGILMPFSSDDETIDFVFGVVNWKELADRDVTDALEAEIGDALRAPPARRATTSVWAGGPAALPPSSPTDDASLADWLALARSGAEQVQATEARSHAALYRTIGLAYDFALVAQARPDDYGDLLADSGIKIQSRSPMTAIIKLVFGAGYDKTRITEYATALDHGRTAAVKMGHLADYLSGYVGGLKALVQDERALRRSQAPARPDRRMVARDVMKSASILAHSAIATDTDGLAIVVARREADGTLALIGALPDGSGLRHRVMAAAVTGQKK